MLNEKIVPGIYDHVLYFEVYIYVRHTYEVYQVQTDSRHSIVSTSSL